MNGSRKSGRSSKTFADKLAEEMDCKTEYLKNVMNDRKFSKEMPWHAKFAQPVKVRQLMQLHRCVPNVSSGGNAF